jgi:hypothetical protein
MLKSTKLSYVILSIALAGTLLLSGCATICGGSTYNAHVIINNNHPQAQIIYLGETRGYGDAIFKVPRKEANRFSFTVQEQGYNVQEYNYTKRTFRVGAFIGSILLWTGITGSGIPIPYGPVIDLATGAIWKPSIYEGGVSQESTKNFKYLITYDSPLIKNVIPSIKNDTVTASNGIRTNNNYDVVYLKNGTIIKGVIIEQIPNVQIKLHISDGTNYIFPFTEIEKIVKE